MDLVVLEDEELKKYNYSKIVKNRNLVRGRLLPQPETGFSWDHKKMDVFPSEKWWDAINNPNLKNKIEGRN